MSSSITISTPAADASLLTVAELRASIGLDAGDGSKDGALSILGARVAGVITNVCKVAASGVQPPTLRRETVTETFRNNRARLNLILSRRPVVTVVSVVESGIELAEGDYEIRGDRFLTRLSNDEPISWSCGKIVVSYQAGWETVPDDLKLAASKLAAVLWSEGERVDPNLRSEEIPGVISRTWWVGPSDDPLVPAEVMDLLTPYINRWGG